MRKVYSYLNTKKFNNTFSVLFKANFFFLESRMKARVLSNFRNTNIGKRIDYSIMTECC